MTKIVIVRSNQDIYDLCVQEYGSLEFLGVLISDNNLNFNGVITQGQELEINDTIAANKDVQDFFELKKKKSQNSYIFKNDIPPLNWDNTNITFDSIVETWDLIKL
jgi:hypothetical protein